MDPVNVKTRQKFSCEKCAFTCERKTDWVRHQSTIKHLKLIEFYTELITVTSKHICSGCSKEYKSNVGLWKHKKKCTVDKPTPISTDIVTQTNPDDKQIIQLLIKENSDFKKENSEFKNIVLEIVKSNTILQQQMVELCKTGTHNNNNNTINSHNKTFNLQFFLNEQCKDAMNISDFANSFDLQLSDLESVGELGYVDGITKIFLDKLNAMDIYKRPMHCSDAKREILYIKDNNIWTKEEKNNPKLRQVIKNVSFNNMKLVYNWSNAYPESKNNESRMSDKYIKLVLQSSGGQGPILESENKIIRRIAKEIVIGKNNM